MTIFKLPWEKLNFLVTSDSYGRNLHIYININIFFLDYLVSKVQALTQTIMDFRRRKKVSHFIGSAGYIKTGITYHIDGHKSCLERMAAVVQPTSPKELVEQMAKNIEKNHMNE